MKGMIGMRSMKRLAALALALAMCVPASAFAAETVGGEGVSSVSSPGTGSAPVELTADVSNIDVTVPTGVATYIHADAAVVPVS